MNWKKERDLFITQTAAFVQSLGGRPPELPSRAGTEQSDHLSPDVERRPQGKPLDAGLASTKPDASSEEPRGLKRLTSGAPSEFRREIERHIVNFRANQQRFHREREEYCRATLARARAANATARAAEQIIGRDYASVRPTKR